MAFKMKNPSVAKMVKMAGNNRTAMKMKAEEAAAMKMKKAAMKLKEEAAMKMKGRSLTSDSAHGEGGTGKKEYTQQDRRTARAKKQSAMKANKPDFPDIDGDGNTSESMKKAAADKKSGMKMKKETSKYGKRHDRLRARAKKLDDKSMNPDKPVSDKKFDRLQDRREKLVGKARKIRQKSAEKESPAKMGHSPKKMKKSAMKLDEADKKKAMENAMPEAEVKGRFNRDRDLEKQMTKLESEMFVIKRSRYASNETKQKAMRRVQKQIDALNQKGYFKAKARAGVK